MNIKSMFTAFTLKALLIISCITVGFTSFTKCDAQSIVGKWKVTSVKLFLNAGGPVEHPIPPDHIYQFEFKADKTYIVTDGPGSTSTGTWSVSGNQLIMIGTAEKKAGMEGRTYTFSINGNTMTRTMMTKPPYNTMVYKQEDTSTRMQ